MLGHTLVLAFVLAWSAGAPAPMQSPTAILEGTVVDSSGQVVPGAAVDLRDVATNQHRRTVTRDGHPVGLSRKEFAVLAELLRAEGGVVSAEQLLEKAWDEHANPFTGVVRFVIMMVRRKLGDPPVIETVPGAGYRIL